MILVHLSLALKKIYVIHVDGSQMIQMLYLREMNMLKVLTLRNPHLQRVMETKVKFQKPKVGKNNDIVVF